MEYVIKLTDQQLVVIDRALQEMPFRLAAPVFDAINTQCAEQKAETEKTDDKTAA